MDRWNIVTTLNYLGLERELDIVLAQTSLGTYICIRPYTSTFVGEKLGKTARWGLGRQPCS